MMDETYYSVEQIAELLHMHPKTIQRYIREGKLPAVKIGKSWRVAGHDLSRFTEEHRPHTDSAAAPPQRTRASAVLDITVSCRSEAERMIRQLNAAMQSKPPEYGQASLTTQYLEAEGALRLTLWGNAAFMAAVFATVETYVKEHEDA